MPSLRSTRSRKEQSEILSIQKKENSIKKSSNKTTRAGRTTKDIRSVLKENCGNQDSSCTKSKPNCRKTKKSIMIHEEGSNQPQEAIRDKLPEKMITDSIEDDESSPSKKAKYDECKSNVHLESSEESEPDVIKEKEKLLQKLKEQKEKEGLEKSKMISAVEEYCDNQVHESARDEYNKKAYFGSSDESEPEVFIDNEKLVQRLKEQNAEAEQRKEKFLSLKSQNNLNKNAEEAPSSSGSTNLPKQLLTVISNLYLNVGERLHLDFPPRCLDDLAYCHRYHYRSELPEAPMTSQAHSLRSALQHYRYVLFINGTTDMCHRGEFPGKGIFTKIIELVLSINYTTKHPNVNITSYQQSYHKCIALFSMVVRTFPPCWHKMRPYYVGFLEYGLDVSKISTNKNEPISKSTKIFDILLDLLQETLKKANAEDITTANSEAIKLPESGTVDATSPMPSTELSMCSDYWNQNEYEQKERQKQTFDALPVNQKLERIFTALRLLLQILENDLAMWMLHHNKKTKEWIFCPENRPLIVVLCELTQYTRMTRVARRIFSIFSEAVSKNLCKSRLRVLERFISLLMMASNTADMENTAIGVKYPFLGEQTKTLIEEFFKIFKANNRENISKYMETIQLLRIPYVRYEFIDNVLIMFKFTSSEPLTPQKIASDIAKKRWLKYKPASELTKLDEDISREQYLHLLLDALRSYCEYHGSKTFLHVITDVIQISHITTTNDSIHRWPTHGSGVLILKRITEDITQLESRLKMTVRMSRPKVELPLADICIDEDIISKYRTDLKFIVSLQNVLLKQKETYPDVNFTKWLEYLNDFSPKKSEKETNQ